MSDEAKLLRQSIQLVRSFFSRNRSYFEFRTICIIVCIGSLVHGYALLTGWPGYSTTNHQLNIEANTLLTLGAGLISVAIIRIIAECVLRLDAFDFWGLLDFLIKPEFYFSTMCLVMLNLTGAYTLLYMAYLNNGPGAPNSIQFLSGVLLAGLALDSMAQARSKGFLATV